MILDYLKARDNFGLHIEISREEQLLDTGGGLKKASWFFLQDSAHSDEPFILHNVDVISTIDLRRMLEFHIKKQALATLAVQHRKSSRQLLFDADLRLCGRRVAPDQEPELDRSIPRMLFGRARRNPSRSQPKVPCRSAWKGGRGFTACRNE